MLSLQLPCNNNKRGRPLKKKPGDLTTYTGATVLDKTDKVELLAQGRRLNSIFKKAQDLPKRRHMEVVLMAKCNGIDGRPLKSVFSTVPQEQLIDFVSDVANIDYVEEMLIQKVLTL